MISVYIGAIAIILAVILFKKYQKFISTFDYLGLHSLKPKFLLNFLFQRKSFPDIVTQWYNAFPDEKVYGIFQVTSPLFLIRDPKLVKQLAVKDFDYFMDHRSFVDENTDKLLGRALVNLQGQKWRDMRSTLSPMFTGSKMRQMYGHVANVGQQTTKTMKENILTGEENLIEFKELATKFTVDVIASAAFGIEVNSFKSPDNDFKKIANTLTNFASFKAMMKFMGYMLVPKLMNFFNIKFFGEEIEKFFQETVTDVMKIRDEKGIVRHDMINLLIQAKKGKLSHQTESKDEKINEGFATVEESKVGQSEVKTVWTDEDLAAQAFIFFFAGFDTVATTMGFLAHELMINTEAQEKLFEEIQQMEEKLDGKSITYEQIQGLKYLDQCVSEALRKWPAAPATDRLCVKDYKYDYDGKKFTIKKGLSLLIPIHGFHHDPQYFPNPEKFDPDRFSPENRHNIDPDTYLPFGIGARNCIGSRFALMEIKTIFYYLLKNFSFEVSAKTQIPLQLMKTPIGLRTEKGIWVQLKPRS